MCSQYEMWSTSGARPCARPRRFGCTPLTRSAGRNRDTGASFKDNGLAEQTGKNRGKPLHTKTDSATRCTAALVCAQRSTAATLLTYPDRQPHKFAALILLTTPTGPPCGAARREKHGRSPPARARPAVRQRALTCRPCRHQALICNNRGPCAMAASLSSAFLQRSGADCAASPTDLPARHPQRASSSAGHNRHTLLLALARHACHAPTRVQPGWPRRRVRSSSRTGHAVPQPASRNSPKEMVMMQGVSCKRPAHRPQARHPSAVRQMGRRHRPRHSVRAAEGSEHLNDTPRCAGIKLPLMRGARRCR